MFFGGPEPTAAIMFFVALMGGGAGVPLGVPPGPADPMMARVAPEECLVYYSWSGVGEPDPDSGNSTDALLAEPEIKKLIAEVKRRLNDAALNFPEGERETPQAVLSRHGLEFGQVLLTHPAAAYVSHFAAEGAGPPDVRGGMLAHLGKSAGKLKADAEKLQTTFLGEAATADEIDGHSVYRINLGPDAPEIVWGIIGEYALIGVGEGQFEALLANIKTEAPKWLTDIQAEIGVARTSTVAYVNVQAIKEIAVPLAGPDGEDFQRILSAVGGNNITSLAMVSGFDGEGFILRSLANVDGQARGLLKLADAQPLMHEDLNFIPADSTFALAGRVDLAKLLTSLREVAGEIDPGAAEEFNDGIAEFERETEVDVAELASALGEVWCAYNSPGEGGFVGTGLVVSVDLRDHARAEAQLKKLAARAAEELVHDRGPRLEQFTFQGETIYFLAGGREFFVAPSFCLTKDRFIFALFPQNIKAVLTRKESFKSLAETNAVAPLLKMDGGPSVLFYQDTAELFKLVYPFAQMMLSAMSSEMSEEGFEIDLSLLPPASAIVPHLKPGTTMMARTRAGLHFETRTTFPGGPAGAASPIILGAALPAMTKARDAAKRMQASNNVKQLGLAMHNYHDTYEQFPPAFTTDAEGKKLLSWRVQILPFLDQQELYDRFHHDEPWDSEHNLKLLAEMPLVYSSPSSKAGPGQTVYVVPQGSSPVISGNMRDGKVEKVSMAHVRDGTSNTAMLIEVDDTGAVPWTKPADFQFDPEMFGGLKGQHKEGVVIGMTDGSVHTISNRIDADSLRKLFDRSDGEVMQLDRFRVGGGDRGRPRAWIEEAPVERVDEDFEGFDFEGEPANEPADLDDLFGEPAEDAPKQEIDDLFGDPVEEKESEKEAIDDLFGDPVDSP